MVSYKSVVAEIGTYEVGERLTPELKVVLIYQNDDTGIVFIDAIGIGGKIRPFARIPYHAVHLLLELESVG